MGGLVATPTLSGSKLFFVTPSIGHGHHEGTYWMTGSYESCRWNDTYNSIYLAIDCHQVVADEVYG